MMNKYRLAKPNNILYILNKLFIAFKTFYPESYTVAQSFCLYYQLF